MARRIRKKGQSSPRTAILLHMMSLGSGANLMAKALRPSEKLWRKTWGEKSNELITPKKLTKAHLSFTKGQSDTDLSRVLQLLHADKGAVQFVVLVENIMGFSPDFTLCDLFLFSVVFNGQGWGSGICSEASTETAFGEKSLVS